MATAALPPGYGEVSIGQVFTRGFETIRANPVTTVGVAFLCGGLPAMLINYGSQRIEAQGPGIAATLGILLGGLVLRVLFISMTQGALVRIALAHAERRTVRLGEALATGLRAAVPLVLTGIVVGIGTLLGLVLLIVPGIVVYVMWSVAAPAVVAERIDAMEAISRSTDLTSGARWKVFGTLLILLVASWIFSAIVALIGVLWFGGVPSALAALGQGTLAVYLLIDGVVRTITALFAGVIVTSLYVELRAWKEGPAADALADVFS